MAKLRYERQMIEERLSRAGGDQQGMDSDTMSDASTNQPLTPVQGGDSRWAHIAEPYMTVWAFSYIPLSGLQLVS